MLKYYRRYCGETRKILITRVKRMKKVKTILTIFVLMLTTIWATACSCSGEEELEVVNPSAIKIELVTDDSSPNVTGRYDPDSEVLIIDNCRVGDKFKIKYTISPENVTATEVAWVAEPFENGGKVKPAQFMGDSRSDSAIETITFDVVQRPTEEETCSAKITFRTSVYGKEAICIVKISPKLDDVSTFVAPTGLGYNPTTNTLSWTPVTQVYNSQGMTVPATMKADGSAVGLESYEVIHIGDDGEEIIETIPATQTSISGLEAGKEHSYKIRAIANTMLANSSEFSSTYKFYELLPTATPVNNNGDFSIKLPSKATTAEIYAFKDINTPSLSIDTTEGSDVEFSYIDFDSNKTSTLYYVRTIVYPCVTNEYASKATTGYAIGDVYYFASDFSGAIEVMRLSAPTLTFESTTTNLVFEETITEGVSAGNGIKFNNVTGGTIVNITPAEDYASKFGVKYDYSINSIDANDISTGTNVVTSFPLTHAEPGRNEVTVTIKGDPSNTIVDAQLNAISRTVSFNVFNPANKVSVDGDMLTITSNDGGLNFGGLELYFIAQNGNVETRRAMSKRFETDMQTAFDLSQFNLQEGEYKLYVNRLQLVNDSNKNVIAIPNTESFVSIYKAKEVTPTITTEGTLIFNTISSNSTKHEYYEISLGIDDIYTTPVKIKVSGSSANIPLADIYDKYLEGLKEEVEEDQPVSLDLWFTSDKTITCKIRTVGLEHFNEGRTASISSAFATVSARREASVQEINLNNYTLSFDSSKDTESLYKVELRLGDDKTISAEVRNIVPVGEESGSVINNILTYSGSTTVGSIHLSNIVDSNGKSFEQFVKENVNSSISTCSISITKLGRPSNSSQVGSINSNVKSTPFGVTNQVINVAVDSNYNLSWETPATTKYGYTIKLIDAETHQDITTLSKTTDDCESETVGEEGATRKKLTYNIKEIISDNAGKLIEIIITETKADCLFNSESSPFYVTKLETPTQVKAYTGADGEYFYVWAPIEGAQDYTVTVYGASVPDIHRQKCDIISINGQNHIAFSVTDYCSSLGIGTFTIQVNATGTGTGSQLSDPFIIDSEVSGTDKATLLHLVSKAIGMDNINADDNSIVWTNPLEHLKLNPLYDLSYTNVELVEIKDITTNSYNLSDAGLSAGSYDFTVEPHISFDDSNVVFVGTATTKNITKLIEAVNLRSEGGAFLFDVYSSLGDELKNSEIELYHDGNLITVAKYEETWSCTTQKASETPVTPPEEGGETVTDTTTTQPTETNPCTTYTVVLDGLEAGVYNLRVKIKFDNYLTSNLSEVYEGATKIETVEGLKLNGESDWLEWEADDSFAITQYEIRHWLAGEDRPEEATLKLNVLPGMKDGQPIYQTLLGDGETEVTNPGKFEYFEDDNGVFKFRYKFDETDSFFSNTGDIHFTITALTESNKFFNSSESAETVITKINSVSLTVENGVINIADYVSNGTQQPESYTIRISQLTGEKDSEGKSIVKSAVATDGKTYEFIYEDTQKIISKIPACDLNSIGFTLPDGVKFGDGSNFVSFSSEGAYLIEVIFNRPTTTIKDGETDKVVALDNVLSSDTLSVEKTKLPTTTSIHTNDGEVMWTEVDGAASYTLEVTESDQTKYYFTFDGTINGKTSMTKIDDGVALEYDPVVETPTSSLTREGTAKAPFRFIEGSTYTLRIRANGTDVFHSLWSREFKIQKLESPTDLDITSNSIVDIPIEVEQETQGEGENTSEPQTIKLSIGAPLVTWMNLNTGSRQPSKYVITYSTKGIDVYGQTVLSTAEYSQDIPYSTYVDDDAKNPYYAGRHYYLIDSEKTVGKYYIQMKAYGNTTTDMTQIGYINSDLSYKSDEVIANIVDEVANVKITNGQIAWGNVEGAYQYNVTVSDSEDNVKFETQVKESGVSILDLEAAANGALAGGNGYKFTVQAKTQPHLAIVSTKEDPTSNTTSVYRPKTITGVAVRNGELSWRIGLDDIEAFIETMGIPAITNGVTTSLNTTDKTELAKSIANYVEKMTNHTLAEDSKLNGIIKHLVFVKLNVNDTVIETYPTSAKYDAANRYIEYYYEFGIRTDNKNETFKPGVYNIQVSAPGNSEPTAAVIDSYYTNTFTAYKPNTPRTWTKNGADIYEGRVQWELTTTASSTVNSFKYFNQYEIVAIPSADAVANKGAKEVAIPVNVTVAEENITDYYKYFRNLKDDLFVVNSDEDNNLIADTDYTLKIRVVGTELEEKNYFNSDYASFNETANILDPSKNIVVKNSILDWTESYGSTSTKLYIYGPFDNLVRDAINTTVINNADFTFDVNANWYKKTYGGSTIEQIMEFLYNVHIYGESIVETDADKTFYANHKHRLRVVDVDIPTQNGRVTQYTLTDEIFKGREFEPGAYIIKQQEIGNGKGVVDSYITTGIFAHKLGTSIHNQVNNTSSTSKDNWTVTDIRQVIAINGETPIQSWVGVHKYNNTTTSTIYTWDSESDVWVTLGLNPDKNETGGIFVWDPVAGANGYKIQVWKQPIGGGTSQLLKIEYTRETRYAIPDIGDVYNDSTSEYGIQITPLRTMEIDNFEAVADGIFTADTIDSTFHERVATPQDLSVDKNNGIISWNPIDKDAGKDKFYYYNYVLTGDNEPLHGEFRIMVNDNRTGTADTNYDYINIANFGQTGVVRIRVKNLAPSGVQSVLGKNDTNSTNKVFLNSSYGIEKSIHRLANPDLRLIDGVLYWGTAGDPVTTSTLKIKIGNNDEFVYSEELLETILKYYTDIVDHDPAYSAKDYTTEDGGSVEGDISKYPEGKYVFTVRFNGTEGVIGNETIPFVTSDYMPLIATKLEAPELVNKQYTGADGITRNMVSWLAIDNAEGYQIRVFAEKLGEVETIEETETPDEETTNALPSKTIRIHRDDIARDERFEIVFDSEKNKDRIYFDIAELIEEFSLQSGGNMYVYVQAIGSGFVTDENAPESSKVKPEIEDGIQTNNLYISSSYSRYTTIGIPAEATNISFGADGILTWETKSVSGYDVRVVSKYQINELTQEELKYWIYSSDSYSEQGGSTSVNRDTNEAKAIMASRQTQYNDIIYRTVSSYSTTQDGVTKYDIQVVDTIRLNKAQDGTTPTSYTVTAIATYTEFSIVLMAFDNADDAFASNIAIWGGEQTFQRFQSGDGTTANPYLVRTSDFNNIRNFTSRNFELIEDISIERKEITVNGVKDYNRWTPIDSFSGSLNGAGYTISIREDAMGFASDDYNEYMALFVNITKDGKISNLSIALDLSYKGDKAGLMVAGLAINNYGTISNVDVSGNINILSSSSNNVLSAARAGGIVVRNMAITKEEDNNNIVESQGIIDNCHFRGDITIFDNSPYTNYAGGIAMENNGIIRNSSYTGTSQDISTINSNAIGGIVAVNGFGTIDSCYVNEYVKLSVTDANQRWYDPSSTDHIKYKDGQPVYAGGLIAHQQYDKDNKVDVKATIINCYSKASIEITQNGTTSAYNVAGLIGFIIKDNAFKTDNIYNNFVAVNIVKVISKNGSWNILANGKTLDEDNCKYSIVQIPENQDSGISILALNKAILELKDGEEFVYELVKVTITVSDDKVIETTEVVLNIDDSYLNGTANNETTYYTIRLKVEA